MGGIIKSAEKIGGDVVHGVEHGVSSAANTATSVAKTAVGDVAKGAADVAGTASSAAHGLFDAGKSAFTSVKNVASGAAHDVGHVATTAAKDVGHVATSTAKDVGHVATSVAKDVGHVATSAVHGAEHLAADAKHEVKEGLITATGIGDKLGVGSVLDHLGLGGVNQENIRRTTTSRTRTRSNPKSCTTCWARTLVLTGPPLHRGRPTAPARPFPTRTIRADGQAGSQSDRRRHPVLGLQRAGPIGSLFGSDAHNKFNQYDKAYEQESTQAAKGNQKVFADMSPSMQKFIDTFHGEKSPTRGSEPVRQRLAEGRQVDHADRWPASVL